MRRFARAAVVCAGAPLLALGFGAAPAAWAAPGDHGASVSVNGDPKTPLNTSSAVSDPSGSSTGAPNIAVAVNGSGAFAGAFSGSGNRAIAVNGSTAQAGGTGNSATAINSSGANAVGTDNTALATNCPGGFVAQAFGTGSTTRIHGSHGSCQ
jgi:hypothetical protein